MDKLAKVQVNYYEDRGLLNDLELIDTQKSVEMVVPAGSRKDAVLFTKLRLCQYPNMKHPEVKFICWKGCDDVEVIERKETRKALVVALVLVLIAIGSYLWSI